jgi:hypothetical protein
MDAGVLPGIMGFDFIDPSDGKRKRMPATFFDDALAVCGLFAFLL